MSNTVGNRNRCIDIARGLGILLVVFGHNWIVQDQIGELYRIIFSFHMPLFFFLSGIFLTPDRDFGTSLRQKADSLLKPYAAVLLTLAAWYMVPRLQFSADYFIGMLYATGHSILWIPLWFLPNLFLVQMLALLLLKQAPILKARSVWLAGVIVTLLLLGILLLRVGHDLRPMTLELLPETRRTVIGLPWSLDLALLNSAFLLTGFLIANIARNPGRHSLTITVLSGAIFALLHLISDDTLNLNGRHYDSVLITSLEAFSGIGLIIGLSGLLSRHRGSVLLAYLGEASLFIFIFHAYFQGKVCELFQSMIPQQPHVGAWVGFVAGVAVPVIIFETCRRSRLLSAVMLPIARPQRA